MIRRDWFSLRAVAYSEGGEWTPLRARVMREWAKGRRAWFVRKVRGRWFSVSP